MKHSLRIALASAVLAFSSVSPVFAADDHLITMQEADIRAFIDDVSIVTGKTFLVDPRVQGKVTISSEKTLSPVEVFSVFKEVMRVHGYTTIRTANGDYRITLVQGASQDAPLTTGNGVNGEFSTVILKLTHIDSTDAAKVIKPLMHSQGQVTATQGSKILVVTDYPENLRKARAIVEAMDTNDRVMESIQLRNMSVFDAEEALNAIAGPDATFRVVGVPATNTILLEGAAKELASLRAVISSMDVTGVSTRGAVSVTPLRFVDGESISEILISLLPAYTRDGQSVPTVAHEKGSNTIIISAPAETQAALEAVIRRLDTRRPQVLVEAIIVEISDTAAKELGVQFALGGVNGNEIPFLGTNFSRQAPNLLALAGALAGDDLGLTSTDTSALETAAVNSLIGLEGTTAGIGGVNNDTLFSVIVNAIENDENSNILSTPFVTTLDNVAASFLVGQEIPITTSESLTTTSANPFRTFSREEVGIKLDVLPQISEGDVIRLEIKQEVSSIAGVITSIAEDFVTNKRQIETTVLANDGEIIVLGGLIQDGESFEESKVPVLGDVPVLGNLFRSRGKSRERTSLMVFLRPKIIRNGQDARPLTEYRLNQMRSEDISQSGREVSKLDAVINAEPFVQE